MGRPVSAALAASVVLSTAACELFFSIREQDDGPLDSGSDGGATLEASSNDASSDVSVDADAGENLLGNGDFEQGCEASWAAYHATVGDDTNARTGQKACRMCSTSQPGFFLIPQAGTPSAVPVTTGTHYRMEAWVRTAPGAPSPSQAYAKLAGYTAGGNTTNEQQFGGTVALDGANWVKVAAEMTPNDAGTTRLYTLIASDNVPDGGCILIDDIRVFRP